MRLLTAVCIAIALTTSAHADPTLYAQHAPLALTLAAPAPATVPCYGKFELTLNLAATYDNPFDPDQIDLGADFVSPSRAATHINGFLYQEFSRSHENGETIAVAGDPVWKIRFAPDAPGTWHFTVTARDASGTVALPESTFAVTASSDPGFVRRSPTNPRVFAYADNTPFIPIGENLCYGSRTQGSFAFDDWLPKISAQGGNWIRLWMRPWNCGLEWSAGPGKNGPGDYHGLGVYNLSQAWKLDTILDNTRHNGVYVMLCLGIAHELETATSFFANTNMWKDNPYNIANGGPCAKPADFWTDATARKLFRQRLRYIGARYGYRSNLHGWEFWNETDAPAPWMAEMARCLKGTGEFAGHPADPYRHLISTTYGTPEVWAIPEVDFSMTHNYGDNGDLEDCAAVINNDAQQAATYGKPHLMAEFGIDWRKADTPYDPDGLGINFRHGLWSALTSGDAGSAMAWYWDNYIDPKNLYPAFASLRRFATGVPWTQGAWRTLTCDPPQSNSVPETWSEIQVPAVLKWGKSSSTDFTIDQFGLTGGVTLERYLYGDQKKEFRTVPTLHVNYAQAGQFVVHVNDVSASSLLRISVDGQDVFDHQFSAEPAGPTNPNPEYESTRPHLPYVGYTATFNKDYAVDIPAGAHTITLENVKGDWMTFGGLTLTNYRSSRFPQVSVYGQTNGRYAVLWAQNNLYTWKSVLEKKQTPTFSGLDCALHGLDDGAYSVEWWDTLKGTVVGRDAVTCAHGTILLHLPDLVTDVAARISGGA